MFLSYSSKNPFPIWGLKSVSGGPYIHIYSLGSGSKVPGSGSKSFGSIVVNFSIKPSYKSGLRCLVLSKAWSKRHCSILAWLPLKRTSGTFHPRNYTGRVYSGGASRPS